MFFSLTIFHSFIHLSSCSHTFLPFTHPSPLVLSHICIEPCSLRCAAWYHRPTSPHTSSVFPPKLTSSSCHTRSITERTEKAACWWCWGGAVNGAWWFGCQTIIQNHCAAQAQLGRHKVWRGVKNDPIFFLLSYLSYPSPFSLFHGYMWCQVIAKLLSDWWGFKRVSVNSGISGIVYVLWIIVVIFSFGQTVYACGIASFVNTVPSESIQNPWLFHILLC